MKLLNWLLAKTDPDLKSVGIYEDYIHKLPFLHMDSAKNKIVCRVKDFGFLQNVKQSNSNMNVVD